MQCGALESTSARSSVPFVAFELVMTVSFAMSSFIVFRFRRQFESRQMQRYDRLGRYELVTGGYNSPTYAV